MFPKDSKHIQLDVDTNTIADVYYSSYGEYTVNWKNIIFLPFNNTWDFFMTVLVVVNTLTVLYDITYKKNDVTGIISYMDIVCYSIAAIYLFDTCISIMHRNMVWYRVTREYEPKPMLHLFIDVVTLLPIYEIYLAIKTLAITPHYDNNFITITKTKSFLRLYRVYYYFHKIYYNAGVDQLLFVFLGQFVKLNILINFIAAIWYIIGCWKCKEINWTSVMDEKNFDAKNPLHWWVICYSIIGNAFAHNFKGAVEGITPTERSILILAMLIGFIIHLMVYFGQLTWAYVKIYKRQIHFVQNLENIKMFLKDLNIEGEWYDKTIEYYGIFWSKRHGIKDTPAMFKVLPTPLQKEVTVDIFWEALRHSQMFREEELPFKRALSSIMKSEFFLPGDYVYKVREMKNKMVYILHGIIQILTDEDEESPIISFSGGTVLGELSCMMPCLSITNVRCATYCEVHTLSFHDLNELLRVYPMKRQELIHKMRNRFDAGKEVYVNKMEVNANFVWESRDNSIKWIKRQWHILSDKKKRKQNTEPLQKSIGHTSKYLDMLVLCKEVELKMQVICLRGSCPFILEPNSSFMRACRGVVLIAVALQVTILPYIIAYHRKLSLRTFGFCFLLDCIYWFDIYLKLSTSFKVKNLLLSKSSSIILRQFTRFSFMIDVFASLPVDYIFFMQENQHYACLFKLNRLLKVMLILNFVTSLEHSIWFSNLKAKSLKYFVIYSITSYWYSCFLYATSCFEEECMQKGWFEITALKAGLNMTRISPWHAFILSYYCTFSMYAGIGIDHTDRVLTYDLFLEHTCIFLGYFVFSYWIASLTATYILHTEKQTSYRFYYSSTMKMLEGSEVPLKLKNQFKEMLHFWWYYNKNEDISGSTGILKDATEDLRCKLIKERVVDCLRGVRLFSICDESMLEALGEKCILKTLPPNEEVVTAYSRTTWFHVILRGYVNRESILPGDHELKKQVVLQSGDLFPLFGVLYEILTLLTCTTTTTTELISLSLSDVIEIFRKNPETLKMLKATKAAHIRDNESMFYGQKGRLPDMTPAEHSLGQGNYFTHKMFEVDELTQEDVEYRRPWRELGKWSHLQHLFFRNTINPECKFFIIWECFRCFSIIISIYLEFTSFNFLIDYDSTTIVFRTVGKIVACVDFYIRAHCQYYNNQGILVSHPWCTFKQYVRTTFVIDVIANFPYQFLSLDGILGKKQKPVVNVVLQVFTTPLQLYRVLGYVNYFIGSVQNTSNFLILLKYCIVVVVSLYGAVSFLHITVCPIYLPKYYDPETKTVKCGNLSWVNSIFAKNEKITPTSLHIKYLYVISGMMRGSFTHTIAVGQLHEVFVFVLLCIYLFTIKWIVFCLTITAKLGTNVSLTVYQEQIKSFIKFAKDEYLDEDLINLTIEYYQYNWRKTEGGSINPTLKKLHANLHAEVAFSLYGPSMELVEIFHGCDNGFFRQIGILMSVEHFKKDADIIRINDVQGLMYIVYKGKVDVQVAGMKIATLGNGALFGCFNKQGLTRHTMNVTAKVHVELLSMSSMAFHKAILKFPEVALRLKEATVFGAEFLESRKRINFAKDEATVQTTKVNRNVVKSTFTKIINQLAITINHDSNFYKSWEYFIYVHLPHLDSLFMMIYLTTETMLTVHAIARAIVYVTDVLVLIKMYLHFNLTFVDSESGLIVKNHKIISLNYIKSMKFWVDVCSTIPLEFITPAFITNEHVITYSMSNRLLRVLYMRQYYFKTLTKLNVKAHLRWTNLMYTMFITLEIATCWWWLLACLNGRCRYLTEQIGEHEHGIAWTKVGLDSITMALQFIVSLFTMTGMNESYPLTIPQYIGTMIVLIIFEYTVVFLCSEFTSLVGVGQHLMNNYEYEIRQLRMFLKGRELSKPLISKVWTYCLQLWTRQRGESLPLIIRAAPNYLKEDVMTALYGDHLRSHFLFANTHVDFLRQLVVHLQRCLFFPGNSLVEKGDIDGSMYYIHEGEVEVYEKHGNNVTFSTLLTNGQSFGENQGLYNTPHTSSYKARTVVDALILKKTDWEYLLEWYPASKEELWRQAESNSLINQVSSESE